MGARLVITGRVQGVFYRDWAVTTARALGVTGWVRNRADGSVEAQAEGPDAAVAAFVAACHAGPERAQVDGVETRAVADEGAAGFARRATA
ncbi:MAG: acylphosphatase [Sphingomonas sp.]|nr:MAG: acylphosphatase [Sphingomonas sp.]